MTVTIGENLSVWTVAEYRQTLLDALGSHHEVILDLEAVAEIDVAGLQLICAARKYADSVQKSLRIGASNALVRQQSEAAALRGGEGVHAEAFWTGGET